MGHTHATADQYIVALNPPILDIGQEAQVLTVDIDAVVTR